MKKRLILLKLNEKLFEFFQDVDGSMSMKRLLTFIFSFLAAIAIVSNLFWGLLLAPILVDFLEYIIIALVLGITSEKFTNRGITSTKANDEVMKQEIVEEIKEVKQEEIKTKTRK